MCPRHAARRSHVVQRISHREYRGVRGWRHRRSGGCDVALERAQEFNGTHHYSLVGPRFSRRTGAFLVVEYREWGEPFRCVVSYEVASESVLHWSCRMTGELL